jgi:penicillin amidase
VHFRSSFIPSGSGSDNWVISGAHSASGAPIAASDPHLEGNRLPAVWYEISASFAPALDPTGSKWRMGITLPGFPDIVMGRNKFASWVSPPLHPSPSFSCIDRSNFPFFSVANLLSQSLTYGFMDQIDFGVYEVKNGKYKFGSGWKDFTVRKEVCVCVSLLLQLFGRC